MKLLVLGDLGVGKTTLIRNYTGEGNPELLGGGIGGTVRTGDYKVSVGAEYSLKRVRGTQANPQAYDYTGASST